LDLAMMLPSHWIFLPIHPQSKMIIIFLCIANGNTTLQTMGKKTIGDEKPAPNVQHILAQTQFIRKKLKNTDIVVAYLETSYHSWPLGKLNMLIIYS
jgi:hypothetical protein